MNQVLDFHWDGSNVIYLNEYQKNDLNQKWLLIGNEIVSKGVQSQADESQCLDVFYGSVDDGAVVGVYSRHGGLNQQWNVTCIEICEGNQANTTSALTTSAASTTVTTITSVVTTTATTMRQNSSGKSSFTNDDAA